MPQTIQSPPLPETELGKGLRCSRLIALGRSLSSPLRLLFLSPFDEEIPPRLALPAETLSNLGHRTTLSRDFPLNSIGEYDAIVAHCPHCDPRLVGGLAARAASRIPVLLDLDLNFEEMPLDHPRYNTMGLGTLDRSKAYSAVVSLAEKICLPNATLAGPFEEAGYSVRVIPDGWSKHNPLWDKRASPHHTLNLGWLGSPGQVEDISIIRRIVMRLLREFPHTRLVLSGDARACQLFDNLPENRRLYLPPVRYEDHPYLLGQVDILLAPLRNIPFNRAISDRWLVEAGVKNISWVSSPSPAALDWGTGGLVANNLDEWHTQLRQLILDEELRRELGRAGRSRAEAREMDTLVYDWLELFYSVIAPQQREGE
jgi:glycosyltransferase involved in cell wall biosynthesis